MYLLSAMSEQDRHMKVVVAAADAFSSRLHNRQGYCRDHKKETYDLEYVNRHVPITDLTCVPGC